MATKDTFSHGPERQAATEPGLDRVVPALRRAVIRCAADKARLKAGTTRSTEGAHYTESCKTGTTWSPERRALRGVKVAGLL